ncbi:MAG: Na+/H+ antiporter subunit E [Gemmatimonadota bacterium]
MPASRHARVIPSAVFIFLFWLVLSASFHPWDLVLGAVLSLGLGAAANRAFRPTEAPSLAPGQAVALLLYLIHLAGLITVAAFHVARRVLDPRLPIAPVTVIHHTNLSREVSRVALANSLTLTPGTLTVELEGSELRIHCLEAEFQDQVQHLEARIARVFEGGAP